jgi:hypothetical protein
VDSEALREKVGANPAKSALADCPLNSIFHGRQLLGIIINSPMSRNTVENRRMN